MYRRSSCLETLSTTEGIEGIQDTDTLKFYQHLVPSSSIVDRRDRMYRRSSCIEVLFMTQCTECIECRDDTIVFVSSSSTNILYLQVLLLTEETECTDRTNYLLALKFHR